MTINCQNFVDQNREVLIDYYKAVLEDSGHTVSEQEALNRQDLEDITQADWTNLTDEERGLIAVLCNRLLFGPWRRLHRSSMPSCL